MVPTQMERPVQGSNTKKKTKSDSNQCSNEKNKK